MTNTFSVPQRGPDYSGQTINGRVILGHIGYGRWEWECVRHGKTGGPLRIRDILNKNGPRCCHEREGRNNPSWKGFNDLPGKYVSQIVTNAEKRGIECTISASDMWDQWVSQSGVCAYTGRPLAFNKTASLDRIDSSVGYVVGNIQWVHKDVNMAKQSMSHESFVQMCLEVARVYN